MGPNVHWDAAAKLELFRQYLICQDVDPKPSYSDIAEAMKPKYPDITVRAVGHQIRVIKAGNAHLPSSPKSNGKKRPAPSGEASDEDHTEDGNDEVKEAPQKKTKQVKKVRKDKVVEKPMEEVEVEK